MVELREDGNVMFRFTGDDAGPVYLVGDFNGWDERAHPMKSKGDCQWQLSLPIPGRSELVRRRHIARCPQCLGKRVLGHQRSRRRLTPPSPAH